MKVEKVTPEVVYKVELNAQEYRDIRAALAVGEMRGNEPDFQTRCGILWSAFYDKS